ncbi:MAG: Fe-S cluster assembly scaffold SufA [Rhodospirillaceae bacterium]|nr:Fe-S cluster assembly scaffold SufA [Rhodospirillaceae bacterium]|tara:strand:- start:469 stop:819 length:351 start_codon:yes stop_codon:yes gene_type:complete
MSSFRENKEILVVTKSALSQLKKLLAEHSPTAAGIRLGVRSGGCSGMTYTMDFAESKEPEDQVLELEGINILIDPMSTMYLVGTEMDFVEEKLGANFVFRNPNETGRCGCGESFSV